VFKRSIFKRLFIVVTFTALSACAGYGSFEYQQLQDPSNALLYVYRTKSHNPGRAPLPYSYPEVFANQQSLGVLHYKTYLVEELPTGQYELKFTGLTDKARWKQRDIKHTIQLQPGETRFIKLDVNFNLDQMNIGQPGPKYSIFVTPVSFDNAQYEIRDTSPAK